MCCCRLSICDIYRLSSSVVLAAKFLQRIAHLYDTGVDWFGRQPHTAAGTAYHTAFQRRLCCRLHKTQRVLLESSNRIMLDKCPQPSLLWPAGVTPSPSAAKTLLALSNPSAHPWVTAPGFPYLVSEPGVVRLESEPELRRYAPCVPAGTRVPSWLERAQLDTQFFRRSCVASLLDRHDTGLGHCNVAYPGGGAWYLPASQLTNLWDVCADLLLDGHPVFLAETRSRHSPDARLCFFLDLDGAFGMPQHMMPVLLTDLCALVTHVFLQAGCLDEVPDGNDCLVVSATTDGRFGCHVVLNSVLVDREQQLFLTKLACKLWPVYGWHGLDVDVAACNGLRMNGSNKVGRYPVVGRQAVAVDQGRAYGVLGTWHFSRGGFVASSRAPGRLVVTAPHRFKVGAVEVDERAHVVSAGVQREVGGVPALLAVCKRDELVWNMAVASVLPGSHPGASVLSLPVDAPPARPHLERRVCPEGGVFVNATGLHLSLLDTLLGGHQELGVGGSTVLEQVCAPGTGEVLFVAVRLPGLQCPVGGTHKHARRELWLGPRDLTLRCFSRRCMNAWEGKEEKRGVVTRVAWGDVCKRLGVCEDVDDAYGSWMFVKWVMGKWGGMAM